MFAGLVKNFWIALASNLSSLSFQYEFPFVCCQSSLRSDIRNYTYMQSQLRIGRYCMSTGSDPPVYSPAHRHRHEWNNPKSSILILEQRLHLDIRMSCIQVKVLFAHCAYVSLPVYLANRAAKWNRHPLEIEFL